MATNDYRSYMRATEEYRHSDTLQHTGKKGMKWGISHTPGYKAIGQKAKGILNSLGNYVYNTYNKLTSKSTPTATLGAATAAVSAVKAAQPRNREDPEEIEKMLAARKKAQDEAVAKGYVKQDPDTEEDKPEPKTESRAEVVGKIDAKEGPKEPQKDDLKEDEHGKYRIVDGEKHYDLGDGKEYLYADGTFFEVGGTGKTVPEGKTPEPPKAGEREPSDRMVDDDGNLKLLDQYGPYFDANGEKHYDIEGKDYYYSDGLYFPVDGSGEALALVWNDEKFCFEPAEDFRHDDTSPRYIGEILDTEDDLAHWGILGMKWGVRRYQNKDGSLTPEGRERYRKQTVDDEFSSGSMKRLGTEMVNASKTIEKNIGWDKVTDRQNGLAEVADKLTDDMTVSRMQWYMYLGAYEDGGQGDITGSSIVYEHLPEAKKKETADAIKRLFDLQKSAQKETDDVVNKAFAAMGDEKGSDEDRRKLTSEIIERFDNEYEESYWRGTWISDSVGHLVYRSEKGKELSANIKKTESLFDKLGITDKNFKDYCSALNYIYNVGDLYHPTNEEELAAISEKKVTELTSHDISVIKDLVKNGYDDSLPHSDSDQNELYHEGRGHLDGGRSGRYPWGSGAEPYQRSELGSARAAAEGILNRAGNMPADKFLNNGILDVSTVANNAIDNGRPLTSKNNQVNAAAGAAYSLAANPTWENAAKVVPKAIVDSGTRGWTEHDFDGIPTEIIKQSNERSAAIKAYKGFHGDSTPVSDGAAKAAKVASLGLTAIALIKLVEGMKGKGGSP